MVVRMLDMRNVWGSNPRLAKSYTALQTVCHHFNIYASNCVALTLWCRDGHCKLVTHFGIIQQVNERFWLLYSLITILSVTSLAKPISVVCIRAHTSRLQKWWVTGKVWRLDWIKIWTPYLPLQKLASLPLVISRSAFLIFQIELIEHNLSKPSKVY